MPTHAHLEKLREGVEAWNLWRKNNPCVRPDLTEADLRGENLSGADFSETSLSGADLSKANLSEADFFKACVNEAVLKGANFRGADLSGSQLLYSDLRRSHLREAHLVQTDLSGADLRGANLSDANLRGTILRGFDLREADFNGAVLIHTILDEAQLDRCRVYGTSVWGVSLKGASQHDLVITSSYEDKVTVDDLKVAQFVYLLLNNDEVRGIIDTITSRVVLILGRFTEERKNVLDALRNELRKRGYTPILFDFRKPSSRDLTETVSTLAHLAKFVIADITEAKSIPHELQKIVPSLPSLPIRPIILDGQFEYGMFNDFGGYLSVLPPYRYQDTDHLLESLEEHVIGPAVNKAEEIAERRKAFEAELRKQL